MSIRTGIAIAIVLAAFVAAPALAEPLKIKPLAERKVRELPAGTLYWRIESFADRASASAAAGDFSLVAESGGKAWLFTLGARGGATRGGTKVAEVGPIPRISAAEYLLRINEATGAPGATTSVHSHPGSEAFYVLSGEQSIQGPSGTLRLHPGHAEAGNGADVPMQVTSTGSGDLHALVMFVVDAGKPFSTPAKLD
jgi:quercetin dioxygenase-like cupin family protein